MLVEHLQNKKKEYKNEKGDSKYIYQKELDKACFQHDMTYEDFKGLIRRTASAKILCVKYLILLKIGHMIDINADLLQ